MSTDKTRLFCLYKQILSNQDLLNELKDQANEARTAFTNKPIKEFNSMAFAELYKNILIISQEIKEKSELILQSMTITDQTDEEIAKVIKEFLDNFIQGENNFNKEFLPILEGTQSLFESKINE